jgi:Asp-tRNA(Asn)/Glu-tRNA(Gln) amidotransferase A subunit family amidase
MAANRSQKSYSEASSLASFNMKTTDILRLSIALNWSVFHYEIKKDISKACKIGKDAAESAIADFGKISLPLNAGRPTG